VEAQVVPAEGKTHVTINWGLGDPDNTPTTAVFEFLRGRCEDVHEVTPFTHPPAGSSPAHRSARVPHGVRSASKLPANRLLLEQDEPRLEVIR
jgi:hypothetical protein